MVVIRCTRLVLCGHVRLSQLRHSLIIEDSMLSTIVVRQHRLRMELKYEIEYRSLKAGGDFKGSEIMTQSGIA